MSSGFRTILVGLGVMASCIAMASLKGPHLLMAFAGASLLCAIRSWMMRNSSSRSSSKMPEAETTPRHPQTRTAGTVYQFPVQNAYASEASGS